MKDEENSNWLNDFIKSLIKNTKYGYLSSFIIIILMIILYLLLGYNIHIDIYSGRIFISIISFPAIIYFIRLLFLSYIKITEKEPNKKMFIVIIFNIIAFVFLFALIFLIYIIFYIFLNPLLM